MKTFYESLLINDASAFFQSHHKQTSRGLLLGKIGEKFLPESLSEQDTSDNENGDDTDTDGLITWNERFKHFITGILEESRHSIAESLHKRWDNHRGECRSGMELDISFRGEEHSRQAVFDERDVKTSRHFAAQSKNDLLRPGTIIELRPAKWGKVSIDQILLGTLDHDVWATSANGRSHRVKGSKSITLYSAKRDTPKDGRYRLYPLTSVLSFARQLEALFNIRPELYPALLQARSDVAQSAESWEEDLAAQHGCYLKALSSPPATATTKTAEASNDDSLMNTCPFNIPKLNEAQESSMLEFLHSSDGSITLVQGPPGTGKSTLLVATICRFLLERQSEKHKPPRIMVCAPSNKAVAVLAARYSKAEKTKPSPFRAAMVIDREKILPEDRFRFKDICIYDWVASMIRELKDICRYSSRRNDESVLESFSHRLCSNIPLYALHPVRGVDAIVKTIIIIVRSTRNNGLEDMISKLEHRLKEIEREIQLLMINKANVIFCTLSSAGSSLSSDQTVSKD